MLTSAYHGILIHRFSSMETRTTAKYPSAKEKQASNVTQWWNQQQSARAAHCTQQFNVLTSVYAKTSDMLAALIDQTELEPPAYPKSTTYCRMNICMG